MSAEPRDAASRSVDDIERRALRVLAGTQTGEYTKRMLAYDILALVKVAQAADDLMRFDRGLTFAAALPPDEAELHVTAAAHTRLSDALREVSGDA